MNRRAFIQSATMAGLAPVMASAQSNAETVRTGMIGTGLRGQHTLGKLMKQPGVTVSALCDLKADRLDKAASITSRDNPKTYREYRKLLDQKDLNAVFIDTPCYLHSEMAIAALKPVRTFTVKSPSESHRSRCRRFSRPPARRRKSSRQDSRCGRLAGWQTQSPKFTMAWRARWSWSRRSGMRPGISTTTDLQPTGSSMLAAQATYRGNGSPQPRPLQLGHEQPPGEGVGLRGNADLEK